MGVSNIFDPIVKSFFKDKGGADTGGLAVYVIPPSAIDKSKQYKIEGMQFNKANVALPAGNISNGVYAIFNPGMDTTANNGMVPCIALWNDSNYISEPETGTTIIFTGETPRLLFIQTPAGAEALAAEIGVYVEYAISDNYHAILFLET